MFVLGRQDRSKCADVPWLLMVKLRYGRDMAFLYVYNFLFPFRCCILIFGCNILLIVKNRMIEVGCIVVGNVVNQQMSGMKTQKNS
jgi:hypothetical protein